MYIGIRNEKQDAKILSFPRGPNFEPMQCTPYHFEEYVERDVDLRIIHNLFLLSRNFSSENLFSSIKHMVKQNIFCLRRIRFIFISFVLTVFGFCFSFQFYMLICSRFLSDQGNCLTTDGMGYTTGLISQPLATRRDFSAY